MHEQPLVGRRAGFAWAGGRRARPELLTDHGRRSLRLAAEAALIALLFGGGALALLYVGVGRG